MLYEVSTSKTEPDERTPGTSGPADRPGKHIEHISAIVQHMAGGDTLANRQATCDYCHPNPGGGGHNDASAPADVYNDGTNGGSFKYIITGAADTGGTYDNTTNTCATVQCHASYNFV